MIELLTANTPNGKKISIMLEEINFEYKVTKININKEFSNKLTYGYFSRVGLKREIYTLKKLALLKL